MYDRIRPFLFRIEPERMHALTLNLLRLTGKVRPAHWLISQIYKAPQKPVEAFGLSFKNPVGLAAGYDKDCIAIRGLDSLGFGHIEIGTVTPMPQSGNPAPRMFRLLEDQAIINRLGFPSRGSEFVQRQLDPYFRESLLEKYFGFMPPSKRRGKPALEKGKAILGINLGKNKDTYLTINVSSPNTAGLRNLQAPDALESLLTNIHQQRLIEQKQLERRVPMLVKLSPDLTDSELNEAIDVILSANMDGIIVTNTTLSREGLRSNNKSESGGLSGSPLKVKSEAVLSQTIKRVNEKIPVVSVGGIMTPEDAKRRLDMGARLIQLYTGLIYHGPSLVRDILRSL